MKIRYLAPLHHLVMTGVLLCVATNAQAVAPGDVVINELAWMGTSTSATDEWIELYNNTASPISLDGMSLSALDGSPSIALSGSIPAGGYFLLERSNDDSVPGIAADQIYTGALENAGEVLTLQDSAAQVIDSVDAWYAGDSASHASMERDNPFTSVWNTATAAYAVGYATPKALNSQTVLPPSSAERLNNVAETPGSINVYFNKSALSDYALAGNRANYHVNLEKRLLKRIAAATQSIDLATYEINLPDVVDALIARAAQGVQVRVIADAKAPSDADHQARYALMRVYLEKLRRGADGLIGSADDSVIFSDSPIFAVEDSALRAQYGLPNVADGLTYVSVSVGTSALSGYLLADAEKKADGGYYSAAAQMHNKFVLIDGQWTWTGSWNFTVTGLYGSEANRQSGSLDGNTQHSLEINSVALAAIYKTEFDEMWGAPGLTPDPVLADFHGRKNDNTVHSLIIGGRTVDVYFSPGDNALAQVSDYVAYNADFNAYFTIFAWSDQTLVDVLKRKWEGSDQDLQGVLTGFDVKGVFDASFWNQWWSASLDMTGRTASSTSLGNPNTRWANPAPVYVDAEVRKLHSKTLLVDVCTASDPSVIVGSTNWSNNGNNVNDENLMIIHDGLIANQFLQEFYARYSAAGGLVPSVASFSCN